MSALQDAMNAQGLGLSGIEITVGILAGVFVMLFFAFTSAIRIGRQRRHMFDRLLTQP